MLIAVLFNLIFYYHLKQSFYIKPRLPKYTITSNLVLSFVNLSVQYEELAYYYNWHHNQIFTFVTFQLYSVGLLDFLLLRAAYFNDLCFHQQTKGRSFFLDVRIRVFTVLFLLLIRTTSLFLQVSFPFFIIFVVANAAIVLFTVLFVYIHVLSRKDSLQLGFELFMECLALFNATLLLIPVTRFQKDRANFSFLGFLLFVFPHHLGSLFYPVLLTIVKTRQNKNVDVKELGNKEKLLRFMSNSKRAAGLKKVAETFFCLELVLFVEAVLKYKRTLIEKDAHKEAYRINVLFLRRNSKWEINVSAEARLAVTNSLEEPDPERILFDNTLNQVLSLVIVNLLPEYLGLVESKKRVRVLLNRSAKTQLNQALLKM